MAKLIVIVAGATMLLCGSVIADEAAKDGVELYMPDGQPKSHIVRVYVNCKVPAASDSVVLHLVGENSMTFPAKYIARNHKFAPDMDDHPGWQNGTLLLFNLEKLPVRWYRTARRVTPALRCYETVDSTVVKTWCAVGPRRILVGSFLHASLWAAVIIVFSSLLISTLCVRFKKKESWRGLIRGRDELASLSRTQICIWTLAIGGMVAVFGLMQNEIPKLPESLVALMGLSLATGTISYVLVAGRTDVKKMTQASSGSQSQKGENYPSFWSGLVSDTNPNDHLPRLSVPQAQMLMWTIVSVVLFVVKSYVAGELWEVPWELVALMGISQAAYLTPMNAGTTKNAPNQDANTNADGAAATTAKNGNGKQEDPPAK